MLENSTDGKRVARNTLFLYFRMLLMMVIGLFTSRITLDALGVDDYGIFNVVGGIIVILSFLNNAMAGGTQRFMNVEMGRKDQNALNKVFSTSQQIHAMVAVMILIIAETLGLWFLNSKMNIPEGREVAANWVFQFSIASALLGIISVPYNAAIISHEKMSAFAYISILEGLLKLLVAFVISIASGDKLIVYASLFFVVGVINRIVYGMYSSRHFEECRCITWRIDPVMMKQMLSFSGWTIFGNLGYILHTQGIAIVINMFFSVAVNAAQGIANQVNGIVTQFSSNFLVALNPQVVKNYASGNLKEMHQLIFRGCKMAFCLLSFFVIPLCLETPVILHIWLGIVPEFAVVFIRLVLLISLVNSFSGILVAAKGATGDIKVYQITLTAIGSLHLPLVYIAFKYGGGPEYSMFIYLVIVIVLQAVRIWFVCRSIQMSIYSFFRNVIIRCLLVFILSVTLPAVFHFVLNPSLINSLAIGILGCVCIIITTIFIALTKTERNAILNPFFRKIEKLTHKYVFR